MLELQSLFCLIPHSSCAELVGWICATKCLDSDTALILLSLRILPYVSWYFRFEIEEPIRVTSSVDCEHFSVLEAATEDKDISHPRVEAPACMATTGFRAL